MAAAIAVSEDGYIIGFPFIRGDEYLLSSAGMLIRQDWLDELNLELPETADDLYQVLKAFKEEKGASLPFSTRSYWLMYVALDHGIITSPFGWPLTGNSVVITSDCTDKVAAVKFLNYGYTEEGRMIFNYGIEGESYTMENGVPTYTELIMNNPEGLTKQLALAQCQLILTKSDGPILFSISLRRTVWKALRR